MVVYNNNLASGFKSNTNFEEVKKAYSYPKGYMNLKIDLKFYLKHFGLIPSFFHLITKNLRFNLGSLKNIIKLYMKVFRNSLVIGREKNILLYFLIVSVEIITASFISKNNIKSLFIFQFFGTFNGQNKRMGM